MTGLVIDASVVASASHHLREAKALYAPDLIDLEVANYFRKAVIRREMTTEVATEQIAAWTGNEVEHFPHTPLLATVWSMRHNITPYDAAYVALAMELDVPLLTADRRLAASASAYCEVILVD